MSAIEVVPDNRGGAADARLGNAERAARFLALVERLGERQARVLRLRFGLDGQPPLTLKAVGGQLGLTRERVRQIEKGAIERLAKALQEV